MQTWIYKRSHYTVIFSATSITEQLAETNWIHSSFARVKLSHSQTHIFFQYSVFNRNPKSSANKRYLCSILLVFLPVCFTRCIVKVSDWILRTVRYRRMTPESVNSIIYLLHEYPTIIFNFRQVCRQVIAEHTLLFCKQISVIHSTLVCSAKPFLNK